MERPFKASFMAEVRSRPRSTGSEVHLSPAAPIQYDTVGGSGWAAQNMSQWHIGYIELKLLKKWPTQEGHPDPPSCLPEDRKEISHAFCI